MSVRACVCVRVRACARACAQCVQRFGCDLKLCVYSPLFVLTVCVFVCFVVSGYSPEGRVVGRPLHREDVTSTHQQLWFAVVTDRYCDCPRPVIDRVLRETGILRVLGGSFWKGNS